MKALIITGSRHGLTQESAEFDAWILPYLKDVNLLIHGDAQGVDAIFKELATDNCIPQLEMPAQWDLHGPIAGPLRNEHMVKVGVSLRACGWTVFAMAFPGPKSKGTKNCVKLLKEYSIAVISRDIGR
jgi:hypothetical protein